MSFKKYAISMIICAVTIFVMIGSAFVPIKSYASITVEQEFANYYYSRGFQQGIPYLFSYFQNLVGYNSSVRDNYNKFCSYNYLNILYITIVNKSTGAKEFKVIKYNSLDSKSTYQTLYFVDSETVQLNFGTSITNDLEIVGSSLKTSFGSRDYISLTNYSSDYYDLYLQFSNNVTSEFDVDKEKGRIEMGIYRIQSLAEWLTDTIGATGAFIYDEDYGAFYDNLRDINRTYVKNFLGTDDDTVVDDVVKSFLNGSYGDVLLGGEPLTADQVTTINNTLSNLQDVYNQTVDISYNEEDNYYHITPSTAYNSYTRNQVVDYYNKYIAYNTTNNYSNVTYNVDLTTTNSFISSVNANIIALHNAFMVLSSSINNFFDSFDARIKNVLVDLGLNNIVTALDLINGSINTNFNALGGVIAGAIGVAWADIKGELKLLIEGINFKFGDISIGDSTSSDDDTSITNKIKINFDSLVDKLNIKLKGLFDDLKVSLDDLFSDIHVTIDSGSTGSSPGTDDTSDDDFLKELFSIIKSKIPLLGQCTELLEPVTNVCIDDVNTNGLLTVEHSTLLLTEQYSLVDYYSIDGQLEFDTPIVTDFFDGLIFIKQSADNSVVALGISLNGVQYYGYTFSGFWLDISYYYNNYRTKLSNLLLFFCYLGFAFSVIHRTSKLFGYSSSSNSNDG